MKQQGELRRLAHLQARAHVSHAHQPLQNTFFEIAENPPELADFHNSAIPDMSKSAQIKLVWRSQRHTKIS
jgi:hypothetical protein